jgi:hypothetical protein
LPLLFVILSVIFFETLSNGLIFSPHLHLYYLRDVIQFFESSKNAFHCSLNLLCGFIFLYTSTDYGEANFTDKILAQASRMCQFLRSIQGDFHKHLNTVVTLIDRRMSRPSIPGHWHLLYHNLLRQHQAYHIPDAAVLLILAHTFQLNKERLFFFSKLRGKDHDHF